MLQRYDLICGMMRETDKGDFVKFEDMMSSGRQDGAASDAIKLNDAMVWGELQSGYAKVLRDEICVLTAFKEEK